MNSKKGKFSTYQLVINALFTAILCVSAYISIPLPNGSHFTFLNFMVMVISLVFTPVNSFIIVGIWLILGCIGVPVFVGGIAGIGRLFSPWGGYNLAFLAVAIVVPFIVKINKGRICMTIASIIGAILVDTIGSLWLMVVGNMELVPAFIAGFAPFIILDIVKAILAPQLAVVLRKITRQHSSNAQSALTN